MALTLTTSGSLNTTVDNYAFSILSNTSSVQLGAVSLRFVIPGGCTIKNVNAGTSSVNNLTFLQQDGNLNIGMWTVSNWVVNTNDVILSITASGMSTGSFTLNTDEDWYCEIASSSAEPFTDFAIKMPSLASPYASVSTTLEAVSILSGVNPSITSVGAPNSSVFGSGSKTSGTASIAEGIGTLASGLASHAAGINTTASGQAAFSMGIETDADGMASFAAGSGSWARGTATVAFGIGTIASSSGQLVVGHYNETKSDINNIFVVGDGTGPLSVNRRNIIEVYGGQGAGLRGVKIDTAATPTISPTINGFNVYGQTYLRGNTDILTNKITSTGDTTLGISGSIIFEAYNSLPALEGRTVMDWKGINFDDAFDTTSPGSTYLWRNSGINHLYYGSSQLIQDGGNNTGAVAQPLIIGTANASNLELETNNTTRLFISSSGRVGIGTSSPTERLHVDGNLLVTGRITAEEFHTEFVSASIIYQSGSTQFGNSLDDTHIFTGSLSVNGSITGSLFGTSSWAINALTASFVNTASTNAFVQGGNSFGTTALLGTNDTQDLQLETSGSVRMTISSSGNIGIGTTTPTNTLQVVGGITATSITASIISASSGITGSLNVLNGNIKINNSYKILGDSNHHLTTYNYDSNFPPSTSASFGLVNIGGVGSYITAREEFLFGSSTILQFFTQGSERARITAGGRLGINTTTPGATLVVKGDSALSSGVTFQALNSSDTTLLYVRDDGNVGIGTTSPTARLHISGANNGALLIASSSTAPSALFVSGSGNVGIGTATPTSLLQVAGRVTSTELYVTNGDAIYTTNGSVGIGTSGPTSTNRLQVRGSGATSATTALRVENSNASASLVALDNGNVGIGTTTPSASLHIEGNFQISTGSLYTYGQNTDIDSGSIRTVMSVSTGSYRAAFFDYVLNKSTNARAGTIFSVWNGASVEWNDVSTNDIGNTAEVNLSVGLSGANVLLYASSSTNDWSMKALARML